MSTVKASVIENQIAIVTFDRDDSKTNLIDAAFTRDLKAEVDSLVANESLKGIVLESAKSTFVAGGDLKMLGSITDENTDEAILLLEDLKASFRSLETMGIPVVACLNGSALGGGLEVALSAHHRIAVDSPSTRVGLPEVSLGLLPAAGGVSRVTRLLGLEKAIPFLTEGKQHRVAEAKTLGLIDEVVSTPEQLRDAALAWIQQNPEAHQPWDKKGYRLPGGLPNSPKIAQMLSIAPAMIKKKTQGCYPAANAILSAAVEGATLSIEAACRIETRYFMQLAKGPVAKNIISTLFFAKNGIESEARGLAKTVKPVSTVGIVGAGMMGAGIAWSCAISGLRVVLIDTDMSSAEKGKAYSQKLAEKRLSRGAWDEEKALHTLSMIDPSDDFAALSECDIVIEAVFEDRALKADVYKQILSAVREDTLLASNTSTLPITGLASSVEKPDQFIGVHFFSPVDKMPLVEIIKGEQTSTASVERALSFVAQIRKTPIVVNDGRGFFTSRVFKMFTYEGMAMLAEGVPAAVIENAAWLAGYPVGPLAVSDEVSITLMDRIRTQTQKDLASEGLEYQPHPGDSVIDRMLEWQRVGKASGAGFYEYPKNEKKRLWSGLESSFPVKEDYDLETLKERFLFVQAIESLKALDENVLTSVEAGNVGSILGFGYPAWTGGVLQYIRQCGKETFVARANEFVEEFGERFSVEAALIDQLGS